MTEREHVDVAVIGGGIGGLALAHRLMQRQGTPCRVTVYERDVGARSRPQGFQIGLNPDGINALRECCGTEPDVLEALSSLFTRDSVQGFAMVDANLSPMMSFGVKKMADAVSSGLRSPSAFGGTVDRWRLRDILADSLKEGERGDGTRAGIVYGKQAVSYEITPTGAVQVRFSDGWDVTADIVIGADGANSKLRAIRTPSLEHRPIGVINTGGFVAFDGKRFPKVNSAVFGDGKRPPHLVRAMSRNGVSVLMLPFRSPDNNMQLILGTTMPAPGGDAIAFIQEAGLDKGTAEPEVLRGRVKQLCLDAVKRAKFDQELITMYSEMDPSSVFDKFRNDLAIIMPMKSNPFATGNEHEGRVTLIGDALHAMTTHRGLGANTALMDAADLGAAIERAASSAGASSNRISSIRSAITAVEPKLAKRGFDNIRASLQSTNSMCLTGWKAMMRDAVIRCIGFVLWVLGK
ncbi:FAD-binding domain-containing protein [Plasmodiophora brassicae]